MTSLSPWPATHGLATLELARGYDCCNLHHLAVFGLLPFPTWSEVTPYLPRRFLGWQPSWAGRKAQQGRAGGGEEAQLLGGGSSRGPSPLMLLQALEFYRHCPGSSLQPASERGASVRLLCFLNR